MSFDALSVIALRRLAVLALLLLLPLLAGRLYWLPNAVGWGHVRLLLVSVMVGLAVGGALVGMLARSIDRHRPPRPVLMALAGVGFAHALFLLGTFPGLIISDALHVYYLSSHGSIDDGYGFLWPLALNAALALLRHPATASVLQLAYFMALLAWTGGWLAAQRSSRAGVILVLLVGLWPAVVVTVTYQHRDVMVALVALHWALHAITTNRIMLDGRGREALGALVGHAVLLFVAAILRPDFAPVAVLLLAAIAWARFRRHGAREARPAGITALALLAAVPLYNGAVRMAVEVQPRRPPYLVPLLIQPVGHILAKGDAARIPEGTMAAFDRVFEPGKLAAMANTQNISILWSPHMRVPADPAAYSDLYPAALRLIAANPAFALENRVMVYLHANGFGGMQQVHQDQAPTDTFAQYSSFGRQDARPPALARAATTVFVWTFGMGKGDFPRVIVWNTLPFVALAIVVLFAVPLASGAWLVAVALVARAVTLFVAAPATQYAYHFPVLLLGVALVLAFMAPRHHE